MNRIMGKDVLDEQTGYHVALINGVNHTTAEHDHDFYEIFLILQGKALHLRNHEWETLVPGTAAFVLPGDNHSYSQAVPGPFRMLNLAFSASEWLRLKEFLNFSGNPWLLKYGEAREAEELAREALMIINNDNTIIRTRKLRVLTSRILIASPENRKQSPLWLTTCLKPENLKNIRRGGTKTLREITGFSAGYLTRAFKAHTGLTPSAWVARERLATTGKLLQNTDWDILRVAHEGGYDNLSHFYRQFRENYGMSPGAFRKASSNTPKNVNSPLLKPA